MRASLAVIADTCTRPDAPPVIAIGAKGFDHTSLEHVLLLAEVRGAVAALPKPIEAPELVLAATHAQLRARPRRMSHSGETAFAPKRDMLCG
jgi:CheY-like chemotaxis protein